MSHDAFWGTQVKKQDVLLKQTQEKMFPEADTSERMYGYSKRTLDEGE